MSIQGTETEIENAGGSGVESSDVPDSLGAEIVESTPEPSTFVEPDRLPGFDAGSTSESVAVESDIPEDVSPVAFDPSIHRLDESGNPVRNKDGSFSKRRGPKGPRKASPVIFDPVQQKERAEADAKIVTQAIFMVGRVIGGDEGNPLIIPELNYDENRELESAWTNYFMVAGPLNIPPWIIAGFVTGSYFTRRAMMPKSGGRLKSLWKWLKRTGGNVGGKVGSWLGF